MEQAQRVECLVNRFRSGEKVLPALEGLRPGQAPREVEAVVRALIHNAEGMRDFYRAMNLADFPDPEKLGPDWALWRWLQAQFIAVAELFGVYGRDLAASRSKLENEVSDLSYLVVAVLAGGLASRDTTLLRRFAMLKPNGEVIK